MSRTSTPSSDTVPSVASKNRGTSFTSVVLPEPVEPMMAVVWPGRVLKLTEATTGSAASG